MTHQKVSQVWRKLQLPSRLLRLSTSVTRKKSPNIFKRCPKMISLKNDRFWHHYKNCLRVWEIWANWLLPKALKSCPTCKKSPNLVTLFTDLAQIQMKRELKQKRGKRSKRQFKIYLFQRCYLQRLKWPKKKCFVCCVTTNCFAYFTY